MLRLGRAKALDILTKTFQTKCMNIGVLQSLSQQGAIKVSRPVKYSNTSNLYKINIAHAGEDNKHIRNYEVWATKEAVQKHFEGMTGEPKKYQLQKFARGVYEDRLRGTNNNPTEQGILVSSTQNTHGNPAHWPSSITDPEVKI